MITPYDVPPMEMIRETAKVLKEEKVVEPLDWTPFVKTGGDREKMPTDPDWWYLRSASLLRKLYFHGPMGIPTLRRKYGGKKNRGHNPDQKGRGSGAVLRKALQQLEKAGLIAKTKEGRVLTPKGISLLDGISYKAASAKK
jgi:small subunit ribosomal protein S19e